MRGVRVTGKSLEYVMFKVPRKAGTFQADLYPPCRTNTPSNIIEDWIQGTDKDPNLIELKPEAE